MRAYRHRVPPSTTKFTCCYVCGRPGGAEAKVMLQRCGYVCDSPRPSAHPGCMAKAISEHRQREFEQAQRQRNAETTANHNQRRA